MRTVVPTDQKWGESVVKVTVPREWVMADGVTSAPVLASAVKPDIPGVITVVATCVAHDVAQVGTSAQAGHATVNVKKPLTAVTLKTPFM